MATPGGPVTRRSLADLATPERIRTVNGWAVLVWLTLIVPTVLFWKESILWVALMSIWANVASHYTAWLAARTEVRAKNVERAENVEQAGTVEHADRVDDQ